MSEFYTVEGITTILMDPHRATREGQATVITLERSREGAASTDQILEDVAAHLSGMTSIGLLEEGLLRCERGRVLLAYNASLTPDGAGWNTTVCLDSGLTAGILPYSTRYLLRMAERNREDSPCLPSGKPEDYRYHHKSGHIGLDVVFITSTPGLHRAMRLDARRKKKSP
jgi:hypothetical protein